MLGRTLSAGGAPDLVGGTPGVGATGREACGEVRAVEVQTASIKIAAKGKTTGPTNKASLKAVALQRRRSSRVRSQKRRTLRMATWRRTSGGAGISLECSKRKKRPKKPRMQEAPSRLEILLISTQEVIGSDRAESNRAENL